MYMFKLQLYVVLSFRCLCPEWDIGRATPYFSGLGRFVSIFMVINEFTFRGLPTMLSGVGQVR
jgi:hypothetical protein